MKIIVTGGAGFIGSHVADAYVKAGHRVVVIDNLSQGSPANVPRKAKFYKADIRSAKALDRIFRKERPDAVNHHAAFISVTESVKKPEETFENNVMGTLNVILAFARCGGARGGAARNNAKKKFLFLPRAARSTAIQKNFPQTSSPCHSRSRPTRSQNILTSR